ncbi:hypothetical protein WMY93_006708 [Mugilogobius chulae]|uniref:Uncharacterized protein n=1 Tax=Mugilogobius chulae TaxID=88201 RepID=A0AAW0PRY2_9GOBI
MNGSSEWRLNLRLNLQTELDLVLIRSKPGPESFLLELQRNIFRPHAGPEQEQVQVQVQSLSPASDLRPNPDPEASNQTAAGGKGAGPGLSVIRL